MRSEVVEVSQVEASAVGTNWMTAAKANSVGVSEGSPGAEASGRQR
jgi:hypothetical protein